MRKCPTCGGELIFNPQKQMLECVRCGNCRAVQGTTTTEKTFAELLKKAPHWKNNTIIMCCESCGAKAVVNRADLAVKCDYCGATNLVKANEEPGFCPDSVIPFQINHEEAGVRAKKYLAKRFFAPHWYQQHVDAKHLQGVYFPVLTFDVLTSSHYTGVQITTQSYTTHVDGKVITQTRTYRTPISGHIERQFDDLLIPASGAIPASVIKDLQPFATNDAKVYRQEFLSGYTTTHADIDPMQCWETAQNQIDQIIQQEIKKRYSSAVENLVVDTKTANITYKYVLLPIYLGHSEYSGEKYELYVNGQSGKVHGKTPISPWKVLLTATLGVAAVLGVIALALFW